MYTPSKVSRVHASSPATSSPLVNSPWSPLYFSDLSSVQPSSAERSSYRNMRQQARPQYRTADYINELPSLRTLHEETQRMSQGFVPVHIPTTSPSVNYYANIGPPVSHMHQQYYSQRQRPRTRVFPRFNRVSKSIPQELISPTLNLKTNSPFNFLEQSPESQSSSSGFGSKNTSSLQNQSSHSDANDLRSLPPYRPPPEPQLHRHENWQMPPTSMNHWLELISRLNSATDGTFSKAIDVGSVDGHYEFDPSTPASTPTIRDDIQMSTGFNSSISNSYDLFGSQRKQRSSRYENIDARVQAMKEEFYEFRKKQAIKRSGGIILESAC